MRSDDEGRGEEDVIAARAVYCALGRICEDVSFEGGLADFFGDGGFLGEGLAGGFVFDEFDGLQEPEAADLANVRMGFQARKRFAKSFAGGRDAIEKLVGFEEIEDGVSCGGGDRMRLVGEAVHEGGGAFFEGVDDAGSDEHGAEGSVTAGDSLSREDDVGFEIPVLAGEGLSGAAHAGHDFVADEKDAVAAANFGDAGGVAVDSGDGAKRRADYWLKDEGSDGGGVVGLEKNL